ncbi:MAG: type II toxin-antitoxin system ParD family antitoxin [Gammaproteobacteria bacterium]|nr:type II toxin-antitoxin system ParD family antitoxin [Gammaproteobacteria bacterium]MDE0269773.1 type II toxin-antitoxin system ParD family antitoxin [Gammaproteobacteria bacterium]
MAVKSSISLTDEQHAFARALVETGHYASLNAILQHGVNLLRQRMDAEELETAALRELLSRREAYSNGPIEGGTPSLRGMTPGSGLPS